MNEQCISLISRLNKKYIINNIEYFLNLTNETLPAINKTMGLSLDPRDIDTNIHIGQVDIKIFSNKIVIDQIQRLSNEDKHKGVIKNILKVIVCKAYELNLDIEILAIPDWFSSKRNNNTEYSKLFKYYNNIGFKKNLDENNSTNYKYYYTKRNNLKAIIDKINIKDGGSKTRKKRSKKRHF